MTRQLPTIAVLSLAAVVATGSAALAQPLGTFRWQLQPYCNVVVVNITQQGALYTIDGYDDQCGAAQRAPLVGLATVNPDGTVGFGLNVVTVPGGRGLQIDARITLPAGDGTWSDSAGGSGTLAFGASAGGGARPLPAASVPAAIHLLTDGGFLAGGAPGVGAIPASGAGIRMMWHPKKMAFRAGNVTGTQWDDVNIGAESVAFNKNTRASGAFSAAFGDSTIASGNASTALGAFTTASGVTSTAMGKSTNASGTYSTAMGDFTTASGDRSTAIGASTLASGPFSTAMGFQTIASGVSSTATGSVTRAEGLVTTVMGTYAAASAAAPGSFVYGDRSTVGAGNGVVTSISPNQFLVRAAGGVAFWSTAGTTYPTSPGVILFTGDSAWSSLSDVNSKENFEDLAGEDVLARIARMPVREWNYKAQGAAVRHVGPTAQDFHAAFGLGTDDRRINTVDADGIALAGVKALEARTRDLQTENDELRARLVRLESLLQEKY